MLVGDVMIAARRAQLVRLHQHLGGAKPLGRLELVTGELDLEAVRIVQVDRVHETAIALDELDAALAQPRRRLLESGPRHVEGDVLDATDLARRVTPRVLARLVGEDGQQPAVAWIEIEVVLVGLAEVGLLEDERHSERSLPEIDGALPRRTDEGDVVHALDLNPLHGWLLA